MYRLDRFANITHRLLEIMSNIWPLSRTLNKPSLSTAVPEDISSTTYFQLTQKSLETLKDTIDSSDDSSDWNDLDTILEKNPLPETLKALVALALDSTFDENNKTIGNPLAPRQIDRETRGYLNTITSHVADRLNDLLMEDESRETFLDFVNRKKGELAFQMKLKDLLGGQTLLDFETLLTELTLYVPKSSETYTKATTVLGDLKMLQDIVAEEEKDKTSERTETLRVLEGKDPRQERA